MVCMAGNVLLAASSEAAHGFCAKVCDFGMARSMDVASFIDTRTYGAHSLPAGTRACSAAGSAFAFHARNACLLFCRVVASYV